MSAGLENEGREGNQGTHNRERSPRMHWHRKDTWVLVIFAVLAAAYAAYLVYNANHGQHVSIAGTILFYLIGAAPMIFGYMLVRRNESPPGEWGAEEFIGCGMIAIGLLYIISVGFEKHLNEVTRHLPHPISEQSTNDGYDPPMVRVSTAEDFDTLTIERIAAPKGMQINVPEGKDVLVRVQMEFIATKKPDGTYSIDPVKVQTGSHGKVWYEIGSDMSRADEF